MDFIAILGFVLAGFSVIANDSVQTLGTWIASNKKNIPWWGLWMAASFVLIITLGYGFIEYGGDISFGRLEKIPYVDVKWYQAIAPLALIFLTRKGVPVSTSFLVLSSFASSVVLGSMLMKSVMGYVIAAIVAYVFWLLLSKILDESKDVSDKNRTYWVIAQWGTTSFLWATWLMHDVANISVFLPRNLSIIQFILVLTFFIICLGFIFYQGGGKIQKIVISKKNTKYIRSATFIDAIYAFILLYFKEVNSIPMSTTWVFVGLLTGRELALNSGLWTGKAKVKEIFPMLLKDFLKLMIGLLVSMGVVLAINFFFNT